MSLRYPKFLSKAPNFMGLGPNELFLASGGLLICYFLGFDGPICLVLVLLTVLSQKVISLVIPPDYLFLKLISPKRLDWANFERILEKGDKK